MKASLSKYLSTRLMGWSHKKKKMKSLKTHAICKFQLLQLRPKQTKSINDPETSIKVGPHAAQQYMSKNQSKYTTMRR